MTRYEIILGAIGDLHRPVSLLAVALTTAYAIAVRPSAEIAAAGVILAALYAVRSWENTRPAAEPPAPLSSHPPAGGGL
jgi:hypothetical protein